MVWKALSGIAVEKAEAYLVDDRDKILRHVEEGPGFVEFNRQVASLLQDWMSRVATDHAFDHLETISQCDALDGRVVDPTRRLSHPKPALPAACGPAENTAEDSVMSAVRVVELLYLQEKCGNCDIVCTATLFVLRPLNQIRYRLERGKEKTSQVPYHGPYQEPVQ